MSRVVSTVVLFLVVFAGVGAEEVVQPMPPGVGGTTTVDQANRFMSAELTRQLQTEMREVETRLQEYQNENFRILDGRMIALMNDIKMKVIIGGIGAVLIAHALGMLVVLRYMREHSFETYLQKIIGMQQEELQAVRGQQGVQQLQQQYFEMSAPEEYPQQPAQTVSSDFGQGVASQGTLMNAWQTTPAYAGAWQAPVASVPQYEEVEIPVERPEEGYLDDPLGSPGWGEGGEGR